MNANDELQDEIIALSVALEVLKRQQFRKVAQQLRESNSQIRSMVVSSGIDSYQARRINALSSQILAVLASSYEEVLLEFEIDMNRLVGSESSKLVDLINAQLGVALASTPSASRIYSAALATPFEGKLLREYFKELPSTLSLLIRAQIRRGYLQQETTSQVIARVNRILRGRQTNFVRSLVNTSIAHFSAFSDRSVYHQNSDIFSKLQLKATLDTRTSPICQSRDGILWDVGSEPRLPFHFNERSRYIPVIRSANDLGVTGSTRASLDGQVPQDTTYKEWIVRQSFSRQSLALGRTRALLIRDGGLSIDDLFVRDRLRLVSEIKAIFPENYKKIAA